MEPRKLNFELAGNVLPQAKPVQEPPRKRATVQISWVCAAILLLISIGCLFAEVWMNHDPLYLDLKHLNTPPSIDFYFGTEALGRDVFSMIWYGGRVSLLIGLLATAVSTIIAVVYGCISGMACRFVDDMMMRLAEIAMSIPSILIIIFLQALLGQSDPVSIAVIIGIASWMNMAKVVRSEVRQLSANEYITAAKCMDAGFFYLLRKHLLPGVFPSIMFMIVTNISAAIGTESTLSFLGIGLPVEVVSWGTMLSQADRALLSNNWWIILIPGLFLVVTMVCITELGNDIRRHGAHRCSNL